MHWMRPQRRFLFVPYFVFTGFDNLYSPPSGRKKEEKNNNNLTKLNYYNIHSTISSRN